MNKPNDAHLLDNILELGTKFCSVTQFTLKTSCLIHGENDIVPLNCSRNTTIRSNKIIAPKKTQVAAHACTWVLRYLFNEVPIEMQIILQLQ